MKEFLPRALLTILLLCIVNSTRAKSAPTFSAPPRVATTPVELLLLTGAADFSAVREAAIKAGDALLEKPVTLPEGYGSWIFYYACSDDGSTLHALSLIEHQCPACKKIYSDERTIAAYRAQQHYNAERAAETLGWAYIYSGDEKYVAEEKRILLKLARDYPTYPARLDRWGFTGKLARLGGRRFVQSLDEAVGIIKLAKGYDLTRNSKLWTDEEKKLVEDNLFGLTAQTLLEFNQDINNHQTWYNAGLMAIAAVRGDADLVNKVLTMKGGFHDQLARSIGSDGLWYEGTMAYHNYALQAMISIVETGKRLGINLDNEPKFKAMISTPLSAAYPNGQFPAINDSDPMNVSSFNGAFAWARKTYNDPVFDNPQVSTQSENLPDAGIAVLRQGEKENAACVFLDYGQHGGGHGHFDKLNITLFAEGREWLLDPGRLSYSHKEYKTWVKETAAHNTVSVGGQSQRATTGKLLFFQNEKNFAACGAQSDGAYDGVLLRRYLLLTPRFLLDVFEVEGEEKAQIDWLAHAVVDAIHPVENLGDGAASTPGTDNGYQHLLDGKSWETTGASRWDFLSDEKNPDTPKLRLWLINNEAEKVLVATGIGYNINQKAPCLIRRRNAASTRFVTAYDLSGRGNYLHRIIVRVDNAWRVETADGVWNIAFTPTGISATPYNSSKSPSRVPALILR